MCEEEGLARREAEAYKERQRREERSGAAIIGATDNGAISAASHQLIAQKLKEEEEFEE